VDERTCPICGEKARPGETIHAATGCPQHCRKPSTLKRIDSALAVEGSEPRQPSFGQRLRDGFAMLRDDDE
jgi:hypothetical protein